MSMVFKSIVEDFVNVVASLLRPYTDAVEYPYTIVQLIRFISVNTEYRRILNSIFGEEGIALGTTIIYPNAKAVVFVGGESVSDFVETLLKTKCLFRICDEIFGCNIERFALLYRAYRDVESACIDICVKAFEWMRSNYPKEAYLMNIVVNIVTTYCTTIHDITPLVRYPIEEWAEKVLTGFPMMTLTRLVQLTADTLRKTYATAEKAIEIVAEEAREKYGRL